MSSPATFNPTSTYGSSLQQVLTRAVGIASLPLTQLNNQLVDLQNRSSELSTINSKFTALQTALNSLNSGVLTASASTSNSSVATVQATTGALPGSYTLAVGNPGAQTTTFSLDSLPKVTDPSSQNLTSAPSVQLTVPGVTGSPFTITATSTLNAMAQAINAAGAGVTATVLNIGSPSSPDYRLSVQSQALGDIGITLDDGHPMLQVLTHGAQATYQVDGQPAPPALPISSSSQTVTLAPGVTATLLQAGTSNITVSQNASGLATTLSLFVAAYNSAVDQVANNFGQSGGALNGDSLLFTLQQSLHNISGYVAGAGSVQSLDSLGISMDDKGHLSFDQSVFTSIASSNPNDVAGFLGSSSTGGFLKAAADIMTNLEDPINGTITLGQNTMQQRITDENNRIADEQSKVNQLQTSLVARLSAADALIASLQSQLSYYTSLFGTMNAKGN